MVTTAVLFLLLAGPQQPRTDPTERTFKAEPAPLFDAMTRAIAGSRWKISHTDKTACFIFFEAPETRTSSGYDATATCEAIPESGTKVRVKARQKGWIRLCDKERGFSKKALDAIAKELATP